MRLLALANLLAALALGQTQNRVFTFAHAPTAQGVQQTANAVRTIAGTQQVTVDDQAKTLAVSGTAGQIAVADWLFHALDVDPATQKRDPQEFSVPGGTDDLARVYYVTGGTPYKLQEITNMSRVLADINRVYPVAGVNAVCARGTSAQIAVTSWLIETLDQSDGKGKYEFTMPGAADGPGNPGSQIRVFFLTQSQTPKAAQELVNAVRTVADINKVYPYATRWAVGIRGHPEEAALAEWLIGMLDRPPEQQAATSAYTTSGTYPPESNAVRVFHLPQDTTGPTLNELATALRTELHLTRIFPCFTPRALALRGTALEMTAAESQIAERRRANR